jgi:hypothetical protein
VLVWVSVSVWVGGGISAAVLALGMAAVVIAVAVVAVIGAMLIAVGATALP